MGTFLIFEVLQACTSKPGFSRNAFENLVVLLLLGVGHRPLCMYGGQRALCGVGFLLPSTFTSFWGRPGCQVCRTSPFTGWAISLDYANF